MLEMSYSGEDHGQPQSVGRGDHILVAYAASWLDHTGASGRCGGFHSVGEWEERFRSDRGSGQGQSELRGFEHCEFTAIDPTGLTHTDS